VLLRKNLTVLDGLDSAVVVVLVGLLVDCCDDLLVLMLLNGLMLHCRCDSLVYSGIVMSGLMHKVGNGGLGFVHCEVRVGNNLMRLKVVMCRRGCSGSCRS
jgi:hypothetical protein